MVFGGWAHIADLPKDSSKMVEHSANNVSMCAIVDNRGGMLE